MRRLLLALPLLLFACSKPAPTPPAQAAAPAPAAADTWPGKYEGNVRVEVSGTPGAHKVSLLAATADCTGDIGLADGGVAAQDVSPSEMTLTTKPDAQTTCRIDLKKAGDMVTVSEDNCGYYHGATCGFAGAATRVK